MPNNEESGKARPLELEKAVKEKENNMESKEVEDSTEGPPPGYSSIQPQQPSPPPPHNSSPSTSPTHPLSSSLKSTPQSSEMAQMVCGSCRRLLKYPRGPRHVQCSCCQTVNFVLEEHEVGQVKCSSCTVLLMYPYGASSVRCSSCRVETEIGPHNCRPPWSVQQGRQLPLPNTLH